MDFVCNQETMSKITKIVQYSREDKQGDKILKSYDKDLGVKWIWDKERWAVYTKDRKGKEYILYVVETPEKGYRRVSSIDRQHIAKLDNARKTKAESIVNQIEQHEVGMDEARKKKLSNDVIAISKERWRQIAENPVIPVRMSL